MALTALSVMGSNLYVFVVADVLDAIGAIGTSSTDVPNVLVVVTIVRMIFGRVSTIV